MCFKSLITSNYLWRPTQKNMKSVLSIFLLLLACSATFSQKIGIEEAVIERFGKYAPENISALQWIEGTDQFSYVQENQLFKSTISGKEKPVVSLDELSGMSSTTLRSFPSITWKSSTKFQFTHKGQYILVDLKAKKSSVVQSYPDEAQNRDLHAATSNLAYTIGNGLAVKLGDEEIKVADKEEGIVSGQAIARYEFGIVKGTFWSPQGDKLAFYEKDERHVYEYPMVDYSSMPAESFSTRYPMAGGHSEYASVGVFNCETQNTIYLNLEGGDVNDNFYATNLAWHPNGSNIFVTIVNRDQNHIWLKMYDSNTGAELKTLFEEKNPKYVEPENPPYFLPGRTPRFLWFSERNGFNNLYLYDLSGNLISNTNQQFVIKSIIGHSPDGKKVFVEATGPNATENHLYRIDIPSLAMTQLTKASGYHGGALSTTGKYLIDRWSSVDNPNQIDIVSESGKVGNTLLKSRNPLEGKKYGTTEIFELEAEDGTGLWARLIKPSHFDENKQYPVIVYTYNGPHVQLVTNRWLGGAPLWMHSMAEEGYIIFTVDGRGSAHRGLEFEQALFRNVGGIEVDDQAHCTRWLKARPWTDPDRFAVHGWSYGGFMTTALMLKEPGLFEVGVAGGPVMDWKLYEVMYTERYMDTPETNPEGFANSDLKNFIKELRGDLLLIHGTSDDIVVLQHNMNFQKESIKQGVQVDFYAYPGYKHNVRGVDRAHLMVKVLGYIMERL